MMMTTHYEPPEPAAPALSTYNRIILESAARILRDFGGESPRPYVRSQAVAAAHDIRYFLRCLDRGDE